MNRFLLGNYPHVFGQFFEEGAESTGGGSADDGQSGASEGSQSAPQEGDGAGDRDLNSLYSDEPGEEGMSFDDLFAPVEGGEDDQSQQTDGDLDGGENPPSQKVKGEQPPKKDDEGGEAEPRVFDLQADGDYQFKVGEQSFNREDMQQALSSHQSKKEWEDRLTKLSMVSNHFLTKMSPEEQERFLAFSLSHTLGKDKLPDDYEAQDFEIPVAIQDEDGLKIEGKHILKPNSPEFKKIEEALYKKFMQEHGRVFRENMEYKQERENFQKERENAEQDNLKKFITENKINLPTDGDLKQTIKMAMLAGETSPYYRDAMRLVNAAETGRRYGKSAMDMYKILYADNSNGSADASQKAVENAQKLQKKTPKRQKPGKSKPATNPDDAFLDALDDKRSNALDEIFAGN